MKMLALTRTTVIELQYVYIKVFLTKMYVYLVLFTIFDFSHEKFISKNCKNIYYYQKFVHLGENSSIYCSQIIVVHVNANVFL